MKHHLFLLLLAIVVVACGKQIETVPNKYQCWIDIYNSDTTILNHRTLWWQGADEVTQKDSWGTLCDMSGIQHIYYSKNNIKLYPSKWPSDRIKPLIQDTNFINYHR